MRAQDEGKASISAILQYDAKISSNSQDTVCGSLARGVGFEPTRPLLTTDLAGLPPTKLGQPRPVFDRLRHLFWGW